MALRDSISSWLEKPGIERQGHGFTRPALIVTFIFLSALGARLFYWQDHHAAFEEKNTLATDLLNNYQREAERIVTQGGVLFPNQPIERGDARMVIHPPGYSIIIAMLYGSDVSSSPVKRLRLLQVLGDSLAAVLVFFIAIELLPLAVGTIAGMIVAFSPHLGYYSLWLSPDSITVLPILGAIYLLIRATKKPRLITVIAAGACLGLSCWLRSNSLLLAPYLAVVMFFIIERNRRILYSATLVGAMVLVIAPITIRNLVVFGRFIPLSIGAGITMIEGIADYDTEQRFGMPQFDKDVMLKDAEWHNRPDYAGNVWIPDGVERDQARLSRGVEVIKSNPGWFLKVMLKRAVFMLRYNESGSSDWPFRTARVPVVSADPGFFHDLNGSEDKQAAWTASPAEMLVGGTTASSQARIELAQESGALSITGDGSAYGDQFISAPIPVKKHTDYLLTIPVEDLQGTMAAKITSPDRRIAIASKLITDPEQEARKESRKRKRAARRGEPLNANEESEQGIQATVELPFASGDRDQVLLVVSNNGRTDEAPFVQLGQARMVEFGPTPNAWTGIPRAIVRGVQKNLYVARHMVPLILAGIILMALARRSRALAILLAVPLYYLLAQSALHTEYRYILAIHYFLFLIAAVAIYCAGLVICYLVQRIRGAWLKQGR